MREAGGTGSPMPEPDDEDPEDFKTKDFKKNDKIGLHRFTQKGKNGRLTDPKTKQYLERDRGRGRSHGGSHWKLNDAQGNRLGTISKDGRWLRE